MNDCLFILHEQRQNNLAGNASNLVNGEKTYKISFNKNNVQLVDADVKQIKLEICKFKDKSFYEH